ncbi:uncharacterized protein AB675_8102 [Cyphellophora attinorum]|uniref:Uncharacterized protein n=1 Tax=Cyphellophora attinorum TaxID=1664694 RepID=A0A0N1H5K5_9EURO|nr:uncharacterized protein AB675_8102 [Phialophora attinorum]KPI41050.1 hypothetical protein AB675_8102 [Phialophora attinorum]
MRPPISKTIVLLSIWLAPQGYQAHLIHAYSLSAARSYQKIHETSLPNPEHIFRTLVSAGRQFPSSLNHNGVSYFLATVPAGTRLYHGRGGKQPVESGFEWLAFEPEHASNFAIRVCELPDQSHSDSRAKGPEHLISSDGSAKWWLSPEQLFAYASSATQQGFPDGCICPPDSRHGPYLRLPHNDDPRPRDQQSILAPPPKGPPRLPKHFCIDSGYLHRYSPISDLHLLYIDGMSAAKCDLGTLASQDDVLLRNSSYRPGPPDPMRGEVSRATGLCDLAQTEWNGKIDGFVRMEHGFEIILCDFAKVQFESAVSKSRSVTGGTAHVGGVFQFLKAIGEDRWWGIGRDRLGVWTDRWVTAYSEPDLDLFGKSIDGKLPDLSGVTDEIAYRLNEQVKDLVMSRVATEDSALSSGDATDWQAVADLYVARYANRLQYLMSFDDAKELRSAAEDMYMVYLDDDADTLRGSDGAIDRCINGFIPPHLTQSPQDAGPMSHEAISAVAKQICTTLHDIVAQPSLADDLQGQKEHLHALMDYLRWPQWSFCGDKRACEIDELCFVAIWPWGSKEDHDSPSCRNQTDAMQHMMKMGSYWNPVRQE